MERTKKININFLERVFAMNTDFITRSASTPNEINTDRLKIHGNCLEFMDTVIQLSNISLFSSDPLVPTKFPFWSLFSIILGLICMEVDSPISAFIAFVLIIGGMASIFLWFYKIYREQQSRRLSIVTNSGQRFYIIFENKEFLETVIIVLKEIIANPGHLRDVNFNIKGNTFTQGAAVFHEYTELNSAGDED